MTLKEGVILTAFLLNLWETDLNIIFESWRVKLKLRLSTPQHQFITHHSLQKKIKGMLQLFRNVLECTKARPSITGSCSYIHFHFGGAGFKQCSNGLQAGWTSWGEWVHCFAIFLIPAFEQYEALISKGNFNLKTLAVWTTIKSFSISVFGVKLCNRLLAKLKLCLCKISTKYRTTEGVG